MKIRSSLLLVIISFFAILLTGCAEKYATKKFKHNTPLIKQDVKILGKKELEKSAEMTMACKKCRKVFRKDINEDFEEADEFCPG